MINTTIKKLDCGTTVVMEKIDHLKSVAMGIWVRAGSVDETPEVSGVSHYIEHMMFKGTGKRTAKQIASDVDAIGGQFNAFTGKEGTCYYIKTLSDNIDKAAEILLDMITNSNMDEEEMDKERKVILEEMKMIQDMPDEDVHDMIVELVFSEHPLGKTIIGTPESLEGIDREALLGYFNAEYTRDSIVVAIAGNFDEENVCNMINDAFYKLAESKEKKDHHIGEYKKGFAVKVKDVEQSHICMAVPALSMDDKDYFAMNTLNNIMGGSMSSRLFQNIREEKGLAYSVFSTYTPYSNGGYFTIYAGVSHDEVEAAIEGIKEELHLLKEEGISYEELLIAKEQMKSSYIFAQENVSTRMFSLGKNMTLLGKFRSQEEMINGYDSVTMDDIERVTELICHTDRYCAAAVTIEDFDLQGIMER